MTNLRKAYIWSTLSAIAYGCMSFLMTLVTMHLCGAEKGGIFSIAFSSAQMLHSVAMFGMRNYQATDVTEQFDSGEYLSSRIATTFGMAVICVIYARVMGFEAEKRIIFLLFCGVKLFEALSDVMEGLIHRKNRLDVASQLNFLRTVFIIAVFIGALLAGLSLTTASMLTFVTAAMGFFLCSWPVARRYERTFVSTNYRRILDLLLQCLPLFLGSAAMSYINNAPKVAIDLNMGDQAQAQFAVIFMPAMVINMISGFIFRPQLNTMAVYYASKERDSIQKVICTVTLLIFGLTVIALGGGYFLGVPALQWVYHVDISAQKNAMLLIIFSGAFCALVNILSQTLTVIRRQYVILVCHLVAATVTVAISNPLIKYCGLFGSAILYFVSMAFLTLLLAFFYLHYIKKIGDN